MTILSFSKRARRCNCPTAVSAKFLSYGPRKSPELILIDYKIQEDIIIAA